MRPRRPGSRSLPGSRPGRSRRGACRGVPDQSLLNPGSVRRIGDQGGGRTAAPISLGALLGAQSELLSSPRLSSSAKSEFFQPSFPGSVLHNEYNDAYRIAWTYPTSSDPNPAPPRGPLPRTRAFGVGGHVAGARQAGLGTALYTPLCICFAGKAPWGVAAASGFFLSVLCTFYL